MTSKLKQVKLDKLYVFSIYVEDSCTEDLRAFSFLKLEFKIGPFPCSHKGFFGKGGGGWGILTGIFGYNIPRMGEKKLLESFCVANYERRRPLGKLQHKCKIILQWFLNRNGGCGLD
jgi:hypothetical protein